MKVVESVVVPTTVLLRIEQLEAIIQQLAINADTFEGRADEGEQLRRAIRKAAEEVEL